MTYEGGARDGAPLPAACNISFAVHSDYESDIDNATRRQRDEGRKKERLLLSSLAWTSSAAHPGACYPFPARPLPPAFLLYPFLYPSSSSAHASTARRSTASLQIDVASAGHVGTLEADFTLLASKISQKPATFLQKSDVFGFGWVLSGGVLCSPTVLGGLMLTLSTPWAMSSSIFSSRAHALPLAPWTMRRAPPAPHQGRILILTFLSSSAVESPSWLMWSRSRSAPIPIARMGLTLRVRTCAFVLAAPTPS
ncbi:hypothetical protein C8J57DRAFT_1515297 [Mycena rebaudengoi]|nr:hypothetical protein C8J57DRAFT_1515297 [Mycena rebaudengoi]